MVKQFRHSKPFKLDLGYTLPEVILGYSTYGTLSKKKDNVVWIFHGFSMDTSCTVWWDGMIGKGQVIDSDKYFIVCVNMPGSCYGSINPLSINPLTGKPYYYDFPFFTPKDMIRAFQLLANFLEIEKIYLGLGPSTGGMQLLEWAVEEPNRFVHIIPMAVGAKTSPWAKAFNATQRMAIELDPSWGQKHENAGKEGIKTARAIALLSYRSYDGFGMKQEDKDDAQLEHFKSDSYQRYQGDKMNARFTGFSYYTLTKSMDSYNLGRNRGGIEKALQSIKSKTLILGIDNDILFPLVEQRYLKKYIKGASFEIIYSDYGHDGFLLEFESIGKHIELFIASS